MALLAHATFLSYFITMKTWYILSYWYKFWCESFPLVLKFRLASVAEWQNLRRLGSIYFEYSPSPYGHLAFHHLVTWENAVICIVEEGAGAERFWVICSRLRNRWRRELNPSIHVSGWLPKLVLFMFLASTQYFGDTRAVTSTVDVFYSRVRIFINYF